MDLKLKEMKRVFAYLPFVFAMALCSQTFTQSRFGWALAASFAAMAFTGHYVYLLLFRKRTAPFEFFFLKIAFAQLFFLLGLYLVNPLLIVLSHFTGWHWGGSLTFYLLSSCAVFFGRKWERKQLDSAQTPSIHFAHYVFAFVAFAALLRIASFFSLSVGALGLDTHQHIYWTNHIVDWGYLAPTARGTDIVELYAKGLHVLTAIWVSLGFQQLTGPFLKVMPFIQSLLPLAIILEALSFRRREASLQNLVFASALAMAFSYVVFYSLRLYFPQIDLNGTGRLVGSVVILSPIAMAFAFGSIQGRRDVALGLMSFLAPFSLIFAAALNPALVVSYLVFTLPLICALAAPHVRGIFTHRNAIAAGGLFSIVMGLAVTLQDPYLLNLVSKAERGNLIERALEQINVYTDMDATKIGKKTEVAFEASTKPQEDQCHSLACFEHRFLNALERSDEFILDRITSHEWLGDEMFFFPARRLHYFIFLLGFFLVWTVLVFRKITFKRFRKSDLSCAILFLLIPVFLHVQQWTAFLLMQTLASDNIYFLLLQGYVFDYPSILGITIGAILFLGLWTVIVDQLLSTKSGFSHLPPSRVALAVIGLSAAVVVSFSMQRPRRIDPLRGFWSPLSHRQIHDVRMMERNIPSDEKIVVPAEFRQIGNESWLLPDGETAKYLPYVRKNYVFNVRLGEGYRYDWRDFKNRFCSSVGTERREFLEKSGIKWLLISGRNVESEHFFAHTSICGILLRDFGAKFPPAFQRSGELAFFRLDPSSIQ